jgi:hypothetical protein
VGFAAEGLRGGGIRGTAAVVRERDRPNAFGAEDEEESLTIAKELLSEAAASALRIG